MLEPLTHFLTGACLGRAGLNRKTALATLTLTLATESPDIDMLAYFRGSVFGFAHHRGFTHSLIGAPLMAAFVIGLVRGWYALMKGRAEIPGPHPTGSCSTFMPFSAAWSICSRISPTIMVCGLSRLSI